MPGRFICAAPIGPVVIPMPAKTTVEGRRASGSNDRASQRILDGFANPRRECDCPTWRTLSFQKLTERRCNCFEESARQAQNEQPSHGWAAGCDLRRRMPFRNSASTRRRVREGAMEDFPLSKRLELHELWLKTNGAEGVRLDLSRESVPGTDTHDAILTGAKLNDADLRHADMNGTDLIGSDLRGADLRGAQLEGADFSAASLKGVRLHGAKLERSNLERAKLAFADLRDANLADANLIEADLMGAKLRGVDMSKAKLRGADLSAADLRDANLAGTDFSYADLQGASFDGAKFDQYTNFSNASVNPEDFSDLDLSILDRENLPDALWAK